MWCPLRVRLGAWTASSNKKSLDVGANLFIGGLDLDVDEKMLYDTFSAFGSIIITPKIMRYASPKARAAEADRPAPAADRCCGELLRQQRTSFGPVVQEATLCGACDEVAWFAGGPWHGMRGAGPGAWPWLIGQR